MVFGSRRAVGRLRGSSRPHAAHGVWLGVQGGTELNNRGQQLLRTGETGAKQRSRAALGTVTRAKHSLVIARQVQGQGRMSVCKSRPGSAGPRPGTGMAAVQQEL